MNKDKEEIILTRVLLVGVDIGKELKGNDSVDFEHSMEELKSLAEAARKEVVGIITQKLDVVNKSLYIGSGKAVEVREYARQCAAEEVVFDNALSPSQVQNLGRELELPVLDRTNLILDIFAIRAKTGEAKMQVEIARLQYMLPRLVGMHEALSRQGGASGSLSNKGTGEKKLELDRRKIERRISELKHELEVVDRARQTQRKKRNLSEVPQVALVGYTNAGKSTILNHIVEKYGKSPEKTVVEKDMLFATLETSVRSVETGDKKPFYLVDTVGFIHKLPHSLIKAFRSTLEEVKHADLLVQVVDFSDDNYRQQMEVTSQTLKELEAGDIPQIIVYNKADKCQMQHLPRVKEKQIYISAKEDIGIEELLGMIKRTVYAQNRDCSFLIPYDKGNIVSYLMENAQVLEREYREDGMYLKVNCQRKNADKYSAYLL